MALSEFSLIDRYFKKPLATGAIGVGDDGAVIPVDLGSNLVVCKDLLVQDRHFFADVNPVHLGHK
jgi:thiamine-monophosphate kinase